MGEQNPFLFNEISRTEHWRVPEIILSQCLKHPNRKIIKFTDGPEWTFKDCLLYTSPSPRDDR